MINSAASHQFRRAFRCSERVVANSEITNFWDYFRLGGRSGITRWIVIQCCEIGQCTVTGTCEGVDEIIDDFALSIADVQESESGRRVQLSVGWFLRRA